MGKQLKNHGTKKHLLGEAGQAATEYILLLVVAVALIMMFKGKILSLIESATDKAGSRMGDVLNQ